MRVHVHVHVHVHVYVYVQVRVHVRVHVQTSDNLVVCVAPGRGWMDGWMGKGWGGIV